MPPSTEEIAAELQSKLQASRIKHAIDKIPTHLKKQLVKLAERENKNERDSIQGCECCKEGSD